jgi:hypothetical protein
MAPLYEDFRENKGKSQVISKDAQSSFFKIEKGNHAPHSGVPCDCTSEDKDLSGDGLSNLADKAGDFKQCSICNDFINFEPSLKLLGMLKKIMAKSYPNPTPHNPGHCSGLSIHIYQPFCELHKFESIHPPLGVLSGWPKNIDFDQLHDHVLQLCNKLGQLLAIIDGNEFFKAMKDTLRDNPTHANGITRQFSNFINAKVG